MQEARIKRGLRFNILVYLGVMMFTALVLTSFVIFKLTATTFSQLEIRRASDSISSFSMGLSLLFDREGVLNKEYLGLIQTIAVELGGEMNIEQLVIVDNSGTPIAKGGTKDGLSELVLDDLLSAMRARETVVTATPRGIGLMSFGLKELTISSPIMRGRRVLGGVKAVFSLEELERNLSITREALIAFVISSTILIMGFGAYYLSRTVIKPIKELVSATENFADGKDAQLEIATQDELGFLAKSFKDMAERIKHRETQLEENLKTLAQVNRDLLTTRNELISSEKRASVGILAQGVAHEIGNPLSAVLGYLEILKKNPSADEWQKDIIKRAEREVERINEIIKELLNYARPSETELMPVDIREVINALITLISGQKKFVGIKIVTELDNDIPLVRANRNKLLQVLVNLTFNSADAMRNGGELIIGAGKRFYTGPASPSFNQAGALTKLDKGAQVIEIWVKDNGAGMTPEVLAKIFDPFFTTKEPGEGTGLGLAISSLILEQFGARLTVESELGKGTTCTITFPLKEEPYIKDQAA